MTFWALLCIWDMYRQDRDLDGWASLCLFQERDTGGETGQVAEQFVPGESAQKGNWKELVVPEKSNAGKLVVRL